MEQNLSQAITKLQDQDIVEFIDDTIQYLKGDKVPFISKYGQTVGFGEVISVREIFISIIQIGVRKSPLTSAQELIKEGIQTFLDEQGIDLDNKYQEILTSCIFARREELRQVFTQLIFQVTADKHLIDYNYNIEFCISSDKFSKVNESILVLELLLRGSDGKKLERVVIEMTKDEAKAFSSKLREIERDLIGASQ